MSRQLQNLSGHGRRHGFDACQRDEQRGGVRYDLQGRSQHSQIGRLRRLDGAELAEVVGQELRVEQVTRGFSPGQNMQGDLFAESLFDSVIYVTFQELATRVSHRNTGRACNDTVADQLLGKIDEIAKIFAETKKAS